MAAVILDAPAERLLLAGASREARAARLIASGRVVLAAFSLLAIWLDPSEPTRLAPIAYALLIVYLAWSVIAAALSWLQRSGRGWLVVSHAIDVGMFILLVFVTEGPSSPFFVFFVFSLVGATVYWGWRGTAVTAAIVLPLYLGLGFYSLLFLSGEGFDLSRFITRSSYLAVVASLLGYLGAHEGQLRADLLRLLDQPEALSDQTAVIVGHALIQAGQLFRGARALFVWEENEEPWVRWGLWSRDSTVFDRGAPGTFGAWVDERVGELTFACRAADAARPFTRIRTAAGLHAWHGPLLDDELRARFQVRAALSAPIASGDLRGRLFVLEPRQAGADDLLLAEIFARRMSARLERLHLLRQLQHDARSELRTRLGRDLHDGVIQSLTAAGLRLEAAQRLLPADSEAGRIIREVEGLLGDEQEDLRSFIRQAPATGVHTRAFPGRLCDRLRDTARRVGSRWDLPIEVTCGEEPPVLDERLAHEIDRIAQEALVNAARHGRATRVKLSLEVEEAAGFLRLVVADDGQGFPFTGRFDLAALNERKLGPLMVKQRVAAAHADLLLDSSPSGARLEIRLPLPNRH